MNRATILTAANPPEHIIDFESIPESLTTLMRWLCWKWVRNAKGKWDKIPVQPNGVCASVSDSATWCSFSDSVAAVEKNNWGIGFVFTGDGLTGLEFDDCRNPASGELDSWTRKVVDIFATYTEVSPSGTGVKLFLHGELPEHFTKKHKRPDGHGEIEIYKERRFFTVTGQRLSGTPDEVTERTRQLASLLSTLGKLKQTPVIAPPKPATVNGHHHSKSDDRQTALAALAVLDPSSHYDDWLKIGMALHSVDASLLGEWDDWSKGSDKYIPGKRADK